MNLPKIASLLLLSVSSSYAVGVVYNFEGENTSNPDPDNRYALSSPWVQTGANATFGGVTYPISYAENWSNTTGGSGTKSGAIGQFLTNSTDQTVSVAAPLPSESLLNTKVTTTIAINDSTAGFTTRDSFGMFITSSGGQTLGSITFTPVNTSTSLASGWTISYTTAAGTATIATPIPANTELNFSLTFLASGVELAYAYADNSSSNAVYYTPTGYSTSGTLGAIGFSTTQSGDSSTWGHSNDFMRFDNITTSVVPEASSFALGAVAGLGLLRRRRA